MENERGTTLHICFDVEGALFVDGLLSGGVDVPRPEIEGGGPLPRLGEAIGEGDVG